MVVSLLCAILSYPPGRGFLPGPQAALHRATEELASQAHNSGMFRAQARAPMIASDCLMVIE